MFFLSKALGLHKVKGVICNGIHLTLNAHYYFQDWQSTDFLLFTTEMLIVKASLFLITLKKFWPCNSHLSTNYPYCSIK